MKYKYIPAALLTFSLTIITGYACGQNTKVVTAATPFLRVTPDARHSGMGDAGIAATPDVYAVYRNLAKTPFVQDKAGIAAGYTPWMGDASNGVYLASATGFYKPTDNQAISLSLRYFKMGKAKLADADGNSLGETSPNEFAIDAGYSRKLSDKFSIGVALRYIHSRLLSGNYNGMDFSAANAVSGDLSLYYDIRTTKGDGFAFGLALTNLGSKINYSKVDANTDFLPANLGLGASYTSVINDDNRISLLLDINKLLVPTAPVNEEEMEAYRNTGVVKSWFNSFKKENGGIRTGHANFGIEYGYKNILAVRMGYAADYSRRMDGDYRDYITFGAGIRFSNTSIDVSYMAGPRIGVAGLPAANTFRFGAAFAIK